ncbi:MAG: RNA methyltransferase [Ruminococcaceae bacterium]|nr:RNA methyltransferase [Oscillospiraceae bacterium]
MEITEITSRQNTTVMWAASLKEKKYREKHQAFLLEGTKLVNEAVVSHLPITHIFVAEGKKASVWDELPWEALTEREEVPRVYLLSDACFEKISTEKAFQGVVAVVKYLDFFKRIDKINSVELPSRALFLSSVRDPGNLGAIVRSAVAFGTEALILSADSADVYHPKVLRAAMGTLFKVSVFIVSDEIGFVRAFREKGRRFFAAELRENAVSLSAFSMCHDDVFVIGNEGHGISPELSAVCDGSVYIPIADGVESLNASVAASVLLWELYKKRGEAVGD